MFGFLDDKAKLTQQAPKNSSSQVMQIFQREFRITFTQLHLYMYHDPSGNNVEGCKLKGLRTRFVRFNLAMEMLYLVIVIYPI